MCKTQWVKETSDTLSKTGNNKALSSQFDVSTIIMERIWDKIGNRWDIQGVEFSKMHKHSMEYINYLHLWESIIVAPREKVGMTC